MSRFAGIILDVDGTLVDSNRLHAQAWAEVFRAAGYDVSIESMQRLIGMGGDKLVPRVTGLPKDASEAEALSEKRGELFLEKYLPQVKPLPGARELVLRMKQEGFHVVVGSSAKKKELEPLLEIAGITDLVGEKASSDDAEASKPDPDIIHAALQALRLAPDRVVMLGDTPYDIEAAKRAGVSTIAVTSGGWSRAELEQAGAVAVYRDPADLLEQFERSELGKKTRAS